MISKHVKDFGRLRMGDILQHVTAPEVLQVVDDAELVYKTLFVKPVGSGKGRQIQFDGDMADEISDDEYMNQSYDLLIKEQEASMEISKVNPSLYRELQFMLAISPDVQSPRSDDLLRAFALEDFDRMIAAPMVFDPEETGRLLLRNNPLTKTDTDKYLAKQAPAMPGAPGAIPGQLPPGVSPAGKPSGVTASGNSPLAAMGTKAPKSPQSPRNPQQSLASNPA